ncbi:MAG: RHS repeat-associated core domain-containing protein [Pseudomonadota bacterium]
MNNGYSRFVGAFPRDSDIVAYDCKWTNFQWLCQDETGAGLNNCDTLWGGYVRLECDSGYTATFPGVCKPDNNYYKEGGCGPEVGNPISLRTGSKILRAKDFYTADDRFGIGRNYRSFPVGRNHGKPKPVTGYLENVKSFPHGLAPGWQFDFGMEIQLGAFSGSPSSPVGYLTLIAPDGTGYDFKLQSNGTFAVVTSTGNVSYDYRVEFIGTLPSDLSTIKNSSSQWKVTGPDDRVWSLSTFKEFYPMTQIYRVARPTAIVHRDGYAQTLTYAADGSLSTIVDSFNRTMTFTWTPFYVSSASGGLPSPEAVSEIGLPDGTRLVYQYDPAPAASPPSTSRIERLIKVEHKDASNNVLESTTYHYEDSRFSFALTGVTDHRGIRIGTYTYDAWGRALSTEGANGANRYEVAYTTTGTTRVRTVTNPLGKVTKYNFGRVSGSSFDSHLTSVDGIASTNCPASAAATTYDTSGFIATTTDEEGRVTSYTRDSRGRPTQIIEAFGTAAARTTTITWHSAYNVPTNITSPDLSTDYVWGTSGRLESRTETDTTSHSVPYPTNGQTRTWAYTYTAEGLVATVDGPLPGTGDTVSYTYDADGYVATYTDELGHVTTVASVNDRGQPTEIEDAGGLITEVIYDDLGRVSSTVADPSAVAATTSFEYDGAYNVTKVTQPNGSFLEMAYDGMNRVASVENNYGDIAEYTYDDMGNVTRVEVSNGFPQLFFQWDRTFDELGRLISLTGVSTETWTYGYDKVGNLKTTTDPNSKTAAFGYDGLNRLVSFADERSDVTTWAYGSRPEPTSTTDDRSVVTGYVRNGWGETIQEDSTDIGTVVYERDQAGNVVERTDARGVVTEFAYDDASRVTSVTYPGEAASNLAYTYDSVAGGNIGIGRLTGVTNAAGTVSYTYDILGRVVSEQRVIGTATYTTGYTYDDAGKLATIVYPSGRTIYYDRDNVGDISVVRQQPSGGATSWLALWVGRTPFGPRSGIQFANDTREWRHYDQGARVTGIEVLKESTSTLYVDRSLSYGDKRNLTGIADLLNSTNNETFTYTDNGFLASAAGPYGTIGFSHDGVGNRTSRVTDTGGGPITESYSIATGSNRLQSVATSGVTGRAFAYDASGNLTQDQDVFYSQTKVYGWNHPGQIASVTRNGVPYGSYTYDYLRRMVVRNVPSGAGTMHRVHDLDGNVIAEYHASGYLMTEYVWLEDRPIAVIADAGGTPRTLWVHTDHLERPILMTNASGSVVWQASFLPFGEVRSITGTETLDYRFPGQWFQMEAGLAYNWHRHYDATTGRYVSPDPIGMPDGPSRYGYAGNTPLMAVDPDGQSWWPILRWLIRNEPKITLLPPMPLRLSPPQFDQPRPGPIFPLPPTPPLLMSPGQGPANMCTPDMPPIWAPPDGRRGECSCNCRMVAGRDVLDPPKPTFAIIRQPDNPGCRATAINACRVAKRRMSVSSYHHEQALCRYNNGRPFAINFGG